MELIRAGKGVDLPDWPDWCYLPVAGAIAVTSGGGGVGLDQVRAAAILAALAAWRVGQGVYSFDATLQKTLWGQPLADALPETLLFRLPEWCVYIPTPDTLWGGQRLYGFFTHLEFDPQTGGQELRIVWDTANALIPTPILLGHGGLAASFHALFAEMGVSAPPAELAEMTAAFQGALNCILYLCAQNRDLTDQYGRDRVPERPQPIRTKRGLRIPPADHVRQWQVGWRVGAAIRQASLRSPTPSADHAHARPRPHLRKAHWHLYWTGPRAGPRTPRVRWLSPIPVGGATGETLVPTIRPVSASPSPSGPGPS